MLGAGVSKEGQKHRSDTKGLKRGFFSDSLT